MKHKSVTKTLEYESNTKKENLYSFSIISEYLEVYFTRTYKKLEIKTFYCITYEYFMHIIYSFFFYVLFMFKILLILLNIINNTKYKLCTFQRLELI